MLVEVCLKFNIAELVSRFLFAVVLTVLLDSIISKMDHRIFYVREVEETARGPDVTFCVIIGLYVPINAGNHCICTNVKLTLLVQ